MSNRSKRYSVEFKKQMVGLSEGGKSPNQIVKEYNIARATVNKWVKDYTSSGSFKAKDNRSEEEIEFIKLRKEN